MAAYSLSERYAKDDKYYRLSDPGAYQYDDNRKVSLAEAPFLSKAPRKTLCSLPVWTDAIYDTNFPPKIPNCTSMISKVPRFPYEALSKEDLEEILCRCGIPKTCQCPIEEEEQKPELEIICQGKLPKHIIKGKPPRTDGDSGLSAPSRGDTGFDILSDGSLKRLKNKVSDESPPFYDARVIEATMFYQGCKWSKWTSLRAPKQIEQTPGPSDYSMEKPPNEIEICAEKVRAKKRKESKQYRYIEMVQRNNILENAPGPASYTPTLPKGTDFQECGPKADRFPSSKYNVWPGPADYCPKRDFELPEPPFKPCQAVLPQPACFGIKAKRFKPRKEEGPSPASYNATYKPCHIQICSKAPFGSTVARFTIDPEDKDIEEEEEKDKVDDKSPCPQYTWEFKSKTVRMKPLEKHLDEPSPADFLPLRSKLKRSLEMQYLAPFYSSDGRFQPWYNWISVYGKLITPGPGYYNIEKPKCYPAVKRGPLSRDRRFHSSTFQTPAPNEYNVGGGIETVLATHNEKLKSNIQNNYQLNITLPPPPRTLTVEEKERLLIDKCIALCDDTTTRNISSITSQVKKSVTKADDGIHKKKLLRYFLYKHTIPICN